MQHINAVLLIVCMPRVDFWRLLDNQYMLQLRSARHCHYYHHYCSRRFHCMDLLDNHRRKTLIPCHSSPISTDIRLDRDRRRYLQCMDHLCNHRQKTLIPCHSSPILTDIDVDQGRRSEQAFDESISTIKTLYECCSLEHCGICQ